MASACLTKPAMNEVEQRWKDYIKNAAPILQDLDSSDPVALELQARLIMMADEFPGDYYAAGAREVESNPAPTASSLIKQIDDIKADRKTYERELMESGVNAGDARKQAEAQFAFPIFNEDTLSVEKKYMLTKSSYKLAKGLEYNWLTPGLYLAPATLSGIADTCSHASDGCRAACLVASGRSDFKGVGVNSMVDQLRAGHRMSDPIEIRIRRTIFYAFNRVRFKEYLMGSQDMYQREAVKKKMSYGVRLNTTSDLGWETEGIMEQHPEITYYDYSKIPNRVVRFLESRAFEHFSNGVIERKAPLNPNSQWPENYYLSFSISETNMAWAVIILAMGGNVVIPFDDSLGGDTLPTHFLGRPVIDGDLFDMRFLDYNFWLNEGYTKELPPYVVGLTVKGVSQRRTQKDVAEEGGFFFSAKQAQESGSDPEQIAKFIARSTHNMFKQKIASKQNPMQFLPTVSLMKQYVPQMAQAYQDAINFEMQAFAKR